MTFDWGTIATALAPTLVLIVTWFIQRRATHAVAQVQKADSAEIKQAVGSVHTLVNGQREALVARVTKLEAENARLKKTGKTKKK